MNLQSLTTPSVLHRTAAALIAEIVMLNKYGTLSPFFWKEKKYKGEYSKNIQCLSRMTKLYPASIVLTAVRKANIKYTSYGYTQAIIKNCQQLESKKQQKTTNSIPSVDGPTDIKNETFTPKPKGLLDL